MKKVEIKATIVIDASDSYAKYLSENATANTILKSCFRNNNRIIKDYSIKEIKQEITNGNSR